MEFLSPPQVSQQTGIPLRTVQTACQQKRLPAEKLGRFYLIAPTDAEEFATKWWARRNGCSCPRPTVHENG